MIDNEGNDDDYDDNVNQKEEEGDVDMTDIIQTIENMDKLPSQSSQNTDHTYHNNNHLKLIIHHYPNLHSLITHIFLYHSLHLHHKTHPKSIPTIVRSLRG